MSVRGEHSSNCCYLIRNYDPPKIGGPHGLDIKGRVHKIHILLIELLAQQLHRLAKPLEVYHLPFPEEFDHIVHIRVIRQPQDVIIGHPGFLFCQGVTKVKVI